MSAARKNAALDARRHKRERDALVRMVRVLAAELRGVAEGDQRCEVDEAHAEAAAILLAKIEAADKDSRKWARIARAA